MTNSEAIETLKANYPDSCYGLLREAVDTAIYALSAQPVARDINVLTKPDLQQPCNKLATDSISIEKLLTFYERRAKELKGVYGDLGGACNGVAKSIKLLTAQSERRQDENIPEGTL